MLYPIENRVREVKSLDGIWNFKIDRNNSGIDEKWYESPLKEVVPMAVPSSFNDLMTETEDREHVGYVWYETNFAIPEGWSGKRIVLRFGSAAHHAVCWLNGQEIIRHKGGFLPFESDITELIEQGDGAKEPMEDACRLTVALSNILDWTYLESGEIVAKDAHASHLKSLDEAARFLYIAPMIGVREGVLFEGEQDMTLEQVLVSEKKPDNILLNCFSDVDKHGSAPAFDDKAYQDWFVCCNMSTCTVYIPVPVGSVVPKGWKGIITTGRCLSMDSYVNSAVRMNTDMIRMGEACGVLASMAMEHGGDSMAVPYPMLKEKLEGRGFVLDKEPGLPSFWTPAMGEKRRFVEWMEKPEDIRAALSTNCPGVALWSCRLLGKEVIGDAVYEMSVSEDEMLRYHAGVALGIMHDERALPILHEIIRNRKTFYFMDCRRSNQMRSVIAICLCGQMEDQGIVEELLSVLRPEEFEKPMYHELLEPRYELSIVKEQNSVYFQHFSHAVAALVKIAQAHEECREEIRSALHAALDDGTYIERITKEPEYNVYHQAAVNCRRYFVNRLEHETDCGKENG